MKMICNALNSNFFFCKKMLDCVSYLPHYKVGVYIFFKSLIPILCGTMKMICNEMNSIFVFCKKMLDCVSYLPHYKVGVYIFFKSLIPILCGTQAFSQV